MSAIKVRDLMVPLCEYATVSKEASLRDAILALEAAQKRLHHDRYKHRAMLVFDEQNKIVGKLSLWDVIKGLEPKYDEIHDFKRLARFGLGPEFVKSMMRDMGLWQKPLDHICEKAGTTQVKDIMYTPDAGEYVDEDATFNEAIHQLIIGHHQALLVTKDREVVGILRLTDVFAKVCEIVKACRAP